ncbi:MAG: DUF5107 domain-containing protein [Bacteroidales bacterium]|nr:DUF5107 domain-containing protein [Bacteroidales bacterium]
MARKHLLLAAAAFMALSLPLGAQVILDETKIVVPTYLVGDPEVDPFFFTGRTSQGAAGHVYPYPLYNNLTDERVDREYKYLTLENEYINIGVMPEIGGRIFDSVDKQNGYHFFYRQHVIRPALIGQIGSWISGGVEWNVPHHHRTSSTLNCGYETSVNPDGSKTVWVGETEMTERLKWTIGLTVYPGKSYVKATFRMENRTPLIQTFLYWANVAVHCNEDYQIIFPPQTVYGTFHSKVNYTDWPMNRIEGNPEPTDNSWWKSFKGSNSTFAVNYKQDFFAGYDHGMQAGVAHYANHNVVPGKKFFEWGTESVWNDMLTETDGPYLELMVGTFSDNQPDYSWIGPGEVRESEQYWYPIKEIRGVKNLNLDAAMNLERTGPSAIFVGFNATGVFRDARVLVKAGGEVLLDKKLDIDPDTPFTSEFSIPSTLEDRELFAGLYDSSGRELISYTPVVKADIRKPHDVDKPLAPEDYDSVEKLLLAGQRLEEFHNGRLSPLPFYEEALKRDSMDSRTNVNLGIYYARICEWEKAEKHLQRAFMRLTGFHYMPEVDKLGAIYQTNPKDGEMYYLLGVVSHALGKYQEAESYWGKSVWYPGFQSISYQRLAQLYWKEGNRDWAMKAIDNCLSLNTKSSIGKFVKAWFLSQGGDKAGALGLLKENVAADPLDFVSRAELARLEGRMSSVGQIMAHAGNPLQEALEAATFYYSVGGYRAAAEFLDAVKAQGTRFSSSPMQKNPVEPYTVSPMLDYMSGYYYRLAGDVATSDERWHRASSMSKEYCFPFRTEELEALEAAVAANPSDPTAHYLLGNVQYYFEHKSDAVLSWEKSAALDPSYGMTWRNLGFAANRVADRQKAVGYYRKAVEADPGDPNFFIELDELEERLAVPSSQRLARMEKNAKTIFKSDNATTRMVYLMVENGKYDKALDILNNRHFRVWEGGKSVYSQFVDAHLLNGLRLMDRKQDKKALDDFLAAGTFPANLETNELSNGPIVAKVAYYQGLAYSSLGRKEEAVASFRRCIEAAGDVDKRRADERDYFVALSQKALGNGEAAAASLEAMQKRVDNLLGQSGRTLVDIYSKFGEDGSRNSIIANALYMQGLICLAQGDPVSARKPLSRSLELDKSGVWARYFLEKATKAK